MTQDKEMPRKTLIAFHEAAWPNTVLSEDSQLDDLRRGFQAIDYCELVEDNVRLRAALTQVAEWCASPEDRRTTSDIEDVVFNVLEKGIE